MAAWESLLKHFSRETNEVFITGANLHIVNGLSSTDCQIGGEDDPDQAEPIPDCPNGLGKLALQVQTPENLRLARTTSGSMAYKGHG